MKLLRQFGITEPVILHCDNQGAMDIAKDDIFRQNTRHVDIKYHYINDRVNEGSIILQYVASEFNAADSLTKGVNERKLHFCNTKMGIH